VILQAVAKPQSQQFWQAFTPKLVIVWREGQIKKFWRSDALAGLTVAIVKFLGAERVTTFRVALDQVARAASANGPDSAQTI
jgi:hypothetical protein